MSVEDRLRNGLARNAASFEPDTESTLERVVSRTRRRSHRRRLVVGFAGVAAAAAAVVGLVLVQRPHDEIRTAAEPEQTTEGTGPVVQALTGRFEATVDDDARGELPFDIAGRWVIELDADGSMQVTAPDTYTGVVSGGVVPGDAGVVPHQPVRAGPVLGTAARHLPLGAHRLDAAVHRGGRSLRWSSRRARRTGVVEGFLNRCQPPVGRVCE